MKVFILMLLVVAGTCNPAAKETPAQPIENNTPNMSNQEGINPNQITVKLKVIEVFESSQNICDNTVDHVMKVGVIEVTESGSSIVNIPNVNDEVLIHFFIAPKNIGTENIIEAKAIESLCRDTSKTYFTVISHKILE